MSWRRAWRYGGHTFAAGLATCTVPCNTTHCKGAGTSGPQVVTDGRGYFFDNRAARVRHTLHPWATCIGESRPAHCSETADTPLLTSSTVNLTSGPASSGSGDGFRLKLNISRKHIIRHARRFGASFDEVYSIVDKIGEGGFGKVYKVEHRLSKTKRAMKEIRATSIVDWNLFISEVEALIELDHPHIIKLVEFFEDGQTAKLIFDLCTGPDLLDRMQAFLDEDERVPIDEVAVILRQMLRSVGGCHSHGIIHRDIKPENFMLAKKEKQGIHSSVKLIDLGLSEHKGEHAHKESVGTVAYMAPEAFTDQYDISADVWSLGVIFYLLLVNDTLFSLADEDDDVIEAIANEKYVPSKIAAMVDVDADAKDLLTKMLKYNPAERITVAEALKHPFFKNATRPEFDKNFFESLCLFSQMPSLKRLALLQVAHLSSDRDTELQRRTFRKMDANGDGQLHVGEIEDFLKKKRGEEFLQENKQRVHDVACEIDCTGKGHIHHIEFLAATLPPQVYLQKHILEMAFQLLDSNADGYIDEKDLELFFESKLSSKEINMILDEAHKDGTHGRISFATFRAMMKG